MPYGLTSFSGSISSVTDWESYRSHLAVQMAKKWGLENKDVMPPPAPEAIAAAPDAATAAAEEGGPPESPLDLPDIIQHGAGVINWVINHLPGEVHLYDKARKMKYEYCGPGTRLAMRLARGDPGINELDVACKAHDIWYRDNRTAESRHEGDLKLAEAAARVARDPNATKDEQEKANLVVAIMHGKKWLGAGLSVQPHSSRRTFYGGDAIGAASSTLGDSEGGSSSAGPGGIWPTIANAVGSLFNFFIRRKSELTSKKEEMERRTQAEVETAKRIAAAIGMKGSNSGRPIHEDLRSRWE